MKDIWFIFGIFDLVLAVFFTTRVLASKRRSPHAMIAWILAFFLIPYLSYLFFLFVGYRRLNRRIRRKPKSNRSPFVSLSDAQKRRPELDHLNLGLQGVANLCEKITHLPAMSGNHLTYIEDTQLCYAKMAEDILAARKSVDLEFYIFQPDETGKSFVELLIQKAKQGVKCRLLVDDVGSYRLHRGFYGSLISAGVKFARFSPVRLDRPWSFHLRNHRKLLTVDGKIGFVGSQNIGNEYLSWKKKKTYWKDAVLRIEGSSVAQIQTLFNEDWEFTTNESSEDVIAEQWFGGDDKSKCAIQVLPTGPDEDDFALEMVITSLIHYARKRVTIVTPYFVPTGTLLLAIECATKRGVVVDIMIPEHSDNWMMDRTARSWFEDMKKVGAQIWIHSRSFLHTKRVTVDDEVALIGSANMDQRSFRLNYECSILVYDQNVVSQMTQSFDRYKKDSILVDPSEKDVGTSGSSVVRGLFKVISPLL